MVLVTGASGNVGRALVSRLDALGANIRVLVRDLSRAAHFPKRIERVVADLDDRTTLDRAFGGVERMFLLTPGVELAPTRNVVSAAQRAGIRHIVHLSSYAAMGNPVPAMGRWHHDRERLLAASGLPTTTLRPTGFMTNALEWISTIREGGYVIDPIGPGRFAPIDPADVAAVAAVVLTGDGHEGKAYLLTGAETLTVAEQVRTLAAVIGRPLELRQPDTPEESVRARFPNGAPPVLAEALVEAYELMRAETVGVRSDTVTALLGREPQTFTAWCRRNADAFRAVDSAGA